MSGNRWLMPEWMKPYANLIDSTGIEYIEEMMSDTSYVQVNAPRALIAVGIKGRVAMISRLRKEMLLEAYDPERIC